MNNRHSPTLVGGITIEFVLPVPYLLRNAFINVLKECNTAGYTLL